MAKTGNEELEGTAGGRDPGPRGPRTPRGPPVLDDFWAVELLSPESQRVVRDPRSATAGTSLPEVSPMAPIFAIGVGCLRYAEDRVEANVERGVGQYVVLGAGFDTFALRRADLAPKLRVFEVDHPDVQRLKRARIEAAEREPAALPEFVPVDFEVTSLAPELGSSSFDSGQPAVFSWLNTLPYLTREATAATLDDLSHLAAPGSELVLNYRAVVELSPRQKETIEMLSATVVARGEPFRSQWKPEEFVALLDERGFEVVEHWDRRRAARPLLRGSKGRPLSGSARASRHGPEARVIRSPRRTLPGIA